ncbi:hypothetical protein SAMN06295888_13811 [Desulfonatronum zhilinae]|nr:hypothetical protein SAMN06295888_13811 [Desulfonatronum zhilinae]
MPKSTIKSFVAGNDLERKIASEAAKRNLSVSKYLKEVLDLYFSLDQDRLERVAKVSNFLDLEVPEVVNAMLRDKLESLLQINKEDIC